jgi:DtxR family Mn-dependent transcriptional regulator
MAQMISGNREDYLINILRITEGVRPAKTTELANYMGVSPASVTEMLKALANDGYLDYERYKGATLTDKGMHHARKLRKKHQIMERFLMDILDVDSDTAHEEACRLEHALSEESMTRLCRMVGTPVDEDCDGCECPCEAATHGKAGRRPLDRMDAGETGTISHLKSDDSEQVRNLISMGFVPGRQITVESRVSEKGPRIVSVGECIIALDARLASAIRVDVK